jgi:hypothetical protein
VSGLLQNYLSSDEVIALPASILGQHMDCVVNILARVSVK